MHFTNANQYSLRGKLRHKAAIGLAQGVTVSVAEQRLEATGLIVSTDAHTAPPEVDCSLILQSDPRSSACQSVAATNSLCNLEQVTSLCLSFTIYTMGRTALPPRVSQVH